MNLTCPHPRVLRLSAVQEITGLSRSTIYAEIKAGRFPKQFNLTSKRCVGFVAEEITAYIQDKVAQSRNLANGGV
jgi:prophage regulatory protein